MTSALRLHRLLPLFFIGWLLVWQHAVCTKNKVNLTAVVDHEEHSSHFEHSSFLSENTQRDAVQKEEAKGTTIQTGALVIEGKKGVTMESATVEADAASITSAHGDVTLTAKAVTNGSYHEKSSSTIGGLFKSRSVDAESKTTLADSTTHAKNQITIGGKNVNLTATSLKTDNGAIALRAEDKVTIQAGMESETKTKIREKSGLFQGGHLWQSKSDSTQTHDEHAKASVIQSGGKGATDEEIAEGAGSVIITAGSADVIGSQIKADNHIIAHTDVGSITIKEAKEQHTRSEVHEEKNLDLTLGVKTGGGGVAVTIAKAEYDKKALTEASTSSAASSLEAGGSVQLTSVEDITIQGSDVAAGGDVALDAQGDVTIREAKDTMDQTTDHTHAEAEVSIGVKNQVAAAAMAAKEVVDATKALKRSKRALDKYKKTLAQYKKDYEAGIISQEDYEEAQSDLKYYQLNVAMAIKNEASAVKNAASAAKGIATSGATGGFTGEVRLDLKGSKTHATAEATSSRASTIVAGHSVQIVTGKTLADGTRDTAGSHTTISGSHIAAGDTIDVSTGRLDITASRDTTRSDASTTSLHASVTAGTAGISGASAGGGISKDRSRTTTHTNSTLTADKLTLHSSGDTNIKGANLHAKSLTSLDVGGNLRVESVQDYESTRSVGVDASVGFSTDRDAKGHKSGTTSTASANYHSKNGTWRSVTNQTSITSEGKVAINTQGNTHLKGALIEGKKATTITTATLTSEDITNRADYRGIDVGVSYTHSTTKGKEKSNGLKPNVGMPQKKNKSATTHTAIADNTQITITDKKHQKQDTSKISTDTEHASYTMTKINTEVLDIRKSVSKDIAKEGFKAVGDIAMKQAAKGDKAWEDGGAKKIIAHAVIGGVAAAVGNGDAISGAVGAGAAEAARPATEGKSEATQQWVSTIVGGVAGGDLTGASTALDGEKYNRQLHQREIALIKKNAQRFADQKGITYEEALKRLSAAALAGVDSEHARHFSGDADAKAFLQGVAEENGGVAFVDAKGRTQHLFEETDRELYENHAVNANDLFGDGAREVYDAGYKNKHPNTSQSYYANTVADLAAGSKDLANEGADVYKQVVIHAADLSEDASLLDKERDKLRHNAQEGVVHGMNYGAIDRDDVSITGDNELSRIWQGSLIDGSNALSVAALAKLPNGNYKVRLKNGKSVEVPAEAISQDSSGRIFIREQYTAPSGRTYNFYGQKIDLDLKVRNPRTGKYETNRERMKRGLNPYVKNENGEIVPTNQHHSQQRASGPIFEIKTSTHQNPTNQQALHPYGKNKNPNDPVDHKNEWNKDRAYINKERVKQLEKLEKENK